MYMCMCVFRPYSDFSKAPIHLYIGNIIIIASVFDRSLFEPIIVFNAITQMEIIFCLRRIQRFKSIVQYRKDILSLDWIIQTDDI